MTLLTINSIAPTLFSYLHLDINLVLFTTNCHTHTLSQGQGDKVLTLATMNIMCFIHEIHYAS